MVLPVVYSIRQGGWEKGIRPRARRACVGEAVPQTITESVTVLVLFRQVPVLSQPCLYTWFPHLQREANIEKERKERANGKPAMM